MGKAILGILMIIIGVSLISVLMVAVVPNVVSIFQSMNEALPWYTSLLIGTSDFLSGYWWILFPSLFISIYWFRRWTKTPNGKLKWHAFEPETKQLYEQVRTGELTPGAGPYGRSATVPQPPQKLDQEIRYFLTPDNVRIAYSVVGHGPPLVWAASFLRHLEFDCQSPIWQHWLEALASRYTLIRYDERACGLSDWDVPDISFAAWVQDLEALVEHLNLDRFCLLALSQAGAVAVAYAARYPDRLSHLILHGAYARGRFQRHDNPQAAEEAQTLLSLTKLGWGQENPAFRQVFSMQLMPEATKEQLAWFDELMRISMTPENAVRAEAEMYNINVLDRLPDVRVPTLVTHCRDDAAVPFAEGRILDSQIGAADRGVRHGGGDRRHALVGRHQHRGAAPTFESAGAVTVETHVLGLDADVYGAPLSLSFIQRLRDERRFPDVDALKEQIQADVRRARRLFDNISV